MAGLNSVSLAILPADVNMALLFRRRPFDPPILEAVEDMRACPCERRNGDDAMSLAKDPFLECVRVLLRDILKGPDRKGLMGDSWSPSESSVSVSLPLVGAEAAA